MRRGRGKKKKKTIGMTAGQAPDKHIGKLTANENNILSKRLELNWVRKEKQNKILHSKELKLHVCIQSLHCVLSKIFYENALTNSKTESK